MLLLNGERVKKEETLNFKVPVDSDNDIINSQVTKNFISSHCVKCIQLLSFTKGCVTMRLN